MSFFYEPPVANRKVDAVGVRVSCISASNGTVAVVHRANETAPQPIFAFAAFAKPIVELNQPTYSLLFDDASVRTGVNFFQRQPAQNAIKHSEDSELPASSTNRAALEFEDAVHSHSLFTKMRCLINSADINVAAIRDKLCNSFLMQRATLNIVDTKSKVILDRRRLNLDVLDDLRQEANLILRKRLISPRLHFNDYGVGPFVKWFSEVVLDACSEAARSPRVARQSKSPQISIDRLALIDTRSQQSQIDELDYFDRFSSMVEKLPRSDMREVVQGIQDGLNLKEIAKRLGIGAKRVARLRKNAIKQLRHIWPQGAIGLPD